MLTRWARFAAVAVDAGREEAERSIAASFVNEHVRMFNAAVDNGAWVPFVDRFAEDAILEFVGPPVGPFVGRAAIYEAYLQSPPNDTIVLNGPPATDDAELVVPYR